MSIGVNERNSLAYLIVLLLSFRAPFPVGFVNICVLLPEKLRQ